MKDEFPASLLFLSPRHVAAPRFAYLPGFDRVACRTPLLLGRARSSETGWGLLSMTVAMSGNSQPIAYRHTRICHPGNLRKIPNVSGRGWQRRERRGVREGVCGANSWVDGHATERVGSDDLRVSVPELKGGAS